MGTLTLSQDAADLLALWREARGDKSLPDAKFTDPIKLRPWLGDISIIRLHEGAKRYFVALHGSNVVRHLGPDFHQRYLEDAIPKAAQAETFAPYELSEKTNQPSYSKQQATLESGLFKSLERMILPCSVDDPDQVGKFLVWVAPIESNARSSSSIFVPFDKTEMLENAANSFNTTAELFLLTDDYTTHAA